MAMLKRRRPREATDAIIQRADQIVDKIVGSGESMPLEYMTLNMHWYAREAERYEKLLAGLPNPLRFRTKKLEKEAEAIRKHYEVMVIKMRALNQAAAENAANYVHARIQSISVGAGPRNRPLTVILSGADALL